jgi:hypothetical protein
MFPYLLAYFSYFLKKLKDAYDITLLSVRLCPPPLNNVAAGRSLWNRRLSTGVSSDSSVMSHSIQTFVGRGVFSAAHVL